MHYLLSSFLLNTNTFFPVVSLQHSTALSGGRSWGKEGTRGTTRKEELAPHYRGALIFSSGQGPLNVKMWIVSFAFLAHTTLSKTLLRSNMFSPHLNSYLIGMGVEKKYCSISNSETASWQPTAQMWSLKQFYMQLLGGPSQYVARN